MADDLDASVATAQAAIKQALPAKPVVVDPLNAAVAAANAAFEKASPEYKQKIFAARQQRLRQPITASPAATTAASAQGFLGGLVKGIFSPVSAFMPDAFNDTLDAWEEDSMRKNLGMMARSQYKSTYEAVPSFSEFLAGSPSAAGELTGSLVPFVPGYEAARTAFKVPEAVGWAKAGKAILAGTTTGGLFAAAAKLDPGESRWGKVAENAAEMGAFELVGIPSMLRAVKEETPNIVKQASGILQKAPEEVEPQLTAIRAGVPASPEAVDAVLDAAKDDPGLKNTPIVQQAAKQKQARSKVASPKVTIDPALTLTDPQHAGQVTISVDGVPTSKLDFRHDPNNPASIAGQLSTLRAQLLELSKSGQDFAVSEVVAGSGEDATNIINALQGKTKKPANPNKKMRGVPGAAPVNSVAENGEVPRVGDKVNIAEPDKPIVQGVVATPDESPYAAKKDDQGRDYLPGSMTLEQANKRPTITQYLQKIAGKKKGVAELRDAANKALEQIKAGRPESEAFREYNQASNAYIDSQDEFLSALDKGEINLDLEIDKMRPRPITPLDPADEYARKHGSVPVKVANNAVKIVPLANLQLPLEVAAKQTADLRPHLNGDTRNAIIHLDTNNISFEGRGAPQDPTQNYFRSELFSSANPDAQWGSDARLFIHPDGIHISVPQLEEGTDLVTAKRAANVLLRNGVGPDSRVTWGAVKDIHTPAAGSGEAMKLRELASHDLPLANFQQLLDDAAERGLSVIPQGNLVTLQGKRGGARTFGDSLSAHEAVLRLPKGQTDKKVEASLEQAWRMGSERAYDPDIDANHFLPVQVQEQGVSELLQGKRPLVPVYTKDLNSLTNTLTKLQDAAGIAQGTIKALPLPAMDSMGRKAVALYSEDAVATAAAKNRIALNFLGIHSKAPEDLITTLSKRGNGHGIYVLAGRDAESAALYASYRDAGNIEAWQKGRLETDSLGTYRRFSKQQKQDMLYPGAGDEKYLPLDIGDSQKPPAVDFKPDSGDKPRMAVERPSYEPDLSFGEESPRWDKKNLPSERFQDTSGPMATIFGQRLRPMMELSKDLQARTGVPFYEWYSAIAAGRNKTEQVVNPAEKMLFDMAKPLSNDERIAVQLLFEGRNSADYVKGGRGKVDISALEDKMSQKVKDTADKLQTFYNDFYTARGFTDHDVKNFFSLFPQIRANDGNFRYTLSGQAGVPRIGALLSKDLENGVVNIDSREFDFQRIGSRLVRSTATEQYLQPTWDRVVKELEAFGEARRISNDTAQIFRKHLQEVLHVPDNLHMSLSKATKWVWSKLGGRMSDTQAADFVSMATQMNYFSNMGWQPGQVLRGLTQVMQTSVPIIGVQDAMEGWKYGLKWWKDPKLQEEMVRRGVIQPNAIYEPLQELSQAFKGSGPVSKAADVFFNKGTRWHANTFDFNKVSAYWGQYTRAMRVGQEYLDKKIAWPEFLEKSKLDMRDAANGPLINKVKNLLVNEGNLEMAAHTMSDDFAKSTQFVYTRGNAPYIMQSTAGRFFFQYGTWPAWYAENLRNMFARGSYKNRAVALSRWVGVQSAMFGTANALFGVDLARWTFFSPLGYQGGPFAQMAIQGTEALHGVTDPSSNDPVSRIARARLLGSAWKQVTPLPVGALTNAFKSLQLMNDGSWQDATRQLLGLPAAKGSLMP